MRTALSRRVSMSVGIVLAAAAVTPFAASTATAAPVAVVSAAETAATPIQVPFLASGGTLLGAGKTGFLSRSEGGPRWTRYTDGVSKVVETPAGEWEVLGTASDTVLLVKHVWHRSTVEEVRVYDMATGAAPVVLKAADIPALDADSYGFVGTTLLTSVYDRPPTQIEVVGGRVSVREVAGLPAFSSWLSGRLPGAALVKYDDGTGHERTGVVDLATARLAESYERSATPTSGRSFEPESFLTPGRVAWTEAVDGKPVLATAVRGRSEVRRIPLGPDADARLTGGLVGDDWFAFGATTGDATPWHTFTARSLKDGTSVPLLDHAWSATPAADGALLVLGVTAARGEGVYRVAVGADGRPAAELIASTGDDDGATPLTYVGTGVPAVIDLDRTARPRLTWTFSSAKADLSVVLTSRATGETFRKDLRPAAGAGGFPDGSLGFDWAAEVADASSADPKAAPNGAYDWQVVATPWNGMPTVSASGSFTVTRTPKPHDFDDNGAPDLVARDGDGYLDQIGTRWDDAAGRLVALPNQHSGLRGWNVYDRVEAVGDLAGSNAADLVARDRGGVLWLHRGTGSSSRVGYESRVRVGGGWNTYARFSGGSDLTGDGRADLVAVDKAGGLYLYKGTGDTSAPFAPRRETGYGWGIYNRITAVGNVGGGPAGDLVARDKDGVLWLYLGRGDGTFAPRTKIGGGWNAYADVVGIGDGNKDGRPDLYARTAQGAAYFYAGTGDWKAPFRARTSTGAGAGRSWAGEPYQQVS
ncbi:VCBS repeat-containing protein [Streptomyces litmocidini]|uniref:VCBS repeat-containing protein n=1 Tax=Streptomyces litmocidini TaxID=67318 RepID=UPI0033C5BB71